MVILIKRSWKHPLEEKSQAEFFGHSRGMPFPFPLMTTVNILSELQTRVLNCSPDISTCVSCTLFKAWLRCPGWPWTCDPPASASGITGMTDIACEYEDIQARYKDVHYGDYMSWHRLSYLRRRGRNLRSSRTQGSSRWAPGT
ncbi:uncharacterized protein LOC144375335 isoform X2 [Ictidomys tridecemlineatus]